MRGRPATGVRLRQRPPSDAAQKLLAARVAGRDAGGLVLAMFYGLLFQVLLDADLAIDGDRMQMAQTRLRTTLPVVEADA